MVRKKEELFLTISFSRNQRSIDFQRLKIPLNVTFTFYTSKRKKRINDPNFRCYKKKKKFDHAASNVCAYRNRFHGCLYPITLNVLTSKSYFPTLSKITILLIDNKRRSYNVSTFIAENCEHARSIEHSKVLSNHFSPLRRVVTISIRGIYFSGKQRDGEAVAG